jgi:hypothetical protein
VSAGRERRTASRHWPRLIAAQQGDAADRPMRAIHGVVPSEAMGVQPLLTSSRAGQLIAKPLGGGRGRGYAALQRMEGRFLDRAQSRR